VDRQPQSTKAYTTTNETTNGKTSEAIGHENVQQNERREVMQSVEKVVNPMSIEVYPGRRAQVYATIKFEDGKLSISGVEGPLPSGDCYGSAGQIDMHLRDDDRSTWKYNAGWNSQKMDKLLEVWERWHLNEMKAGTPKQETFIREHKNEFDRMNWYTEACHALAIAGLLVDYGHEVLNEDGENVGYRYGTAWLREDVPADVVEFLASLPDSKRVPAWI
jgi:hypothetical protein